MKKYLSYYILTFVLALIGSINVNATAVDEYSFDAAKWSVNGTTGSSPITLTTGSASTLSYSTAFKVAKRQTYLVITGANISAASLTSFNGTSTTSTAM